MCCYLIHLERPLKHARHYVGWTKDIDRRLAHHAAGTGARFLQVVNEAGIAWSVVRVWEGQGRGFERKLKDTKSVRDYCPACAGQKVRAYQPKDMTAKTRATRVANTTTDLAPTF